MLRFPEKPQAKIRLGFVYFIFLCYFATVVLLTQQKGVYLMSKKIFLSVVFLVLLMLLVFTGTAFAQTDDPPQSVPNGPWIQPDQKVKYERLMSNEELYKSLGQIEARSKGRMMLELAGYSGDGWPIYVAKFGDADAGKTRILIESQIHGGEPLGTEALVYLIQNLAMSNNPEILNILDKLTIWIIPRLNPDGAAHEVNGELRPRRQNHQTWTPGEWGLPDDAPAPWYYNRIITPPGYDINRDFSPDLDFILSSANADLLPGRSSDPGFFVTSEARAVRDIYKELQPDVFIDLHHRGSNTVSETDNSLCTLQVIAQVTEGTPEYPLDPNVLALSKQINAYVYHLLNERGESPFGGITRYPDVELPGTALGSFTLNGSAIMLYEVRSAAQKSNGMLIKQSVVGLLETFKGLADGSVYDVDPDLYDQIPPAGPRISDPHADF